jgi:hypothetical protein
MPDVVPQVWQHIICRQLQRALKAPQAHIILASPEAAQPQVGPDLGVGHPHLQQAAVVARGQLGLVVVKVVGRQAGDGLHVAGVKGQHLQGFEGFT